MNKDIGEGIGCLLIAIAFLVFLFGCAALTRYCGGVPIWP